MLISSAQLSVKSDNGHILLVKWLLFLTVIVAATKTGWGGGSVSGQIIFLYFRTKHPVTARYRKAQNSVTRLYVSLVIIDGD